MTDLSCTDYSDKAIVVRGETKDHKEDLKKLGGKYNANLRDGPGWIFSKKNEDKVLAYIASGDFEDDKPNKSSSKVVVNQNSTDLLSNIEVALKAMDLKERLVFLGHVARLASSQPVITSAVKTTATIAKKTLKSVEVDSGAENSDEDMRTPKRLLRKEPPKVISKVVSKPVDFDSDAENSDEEPPKRLLR